MMIVLLAAVLLQGAPGTDTDVRAIRESADAIMACAQPDGLIRLYAGTDKETVRPYFSNMAALGLLRAYQATGETRYLAASKASAQWYAAHQNKDGTAYDVAGTPGSQQPTHDYDSSDAYPATFLVLTRELFAVTRDKAWLQDLHGPITLAFKGIKLTWQPDGLTWAKPNYRIKYLMDNLEVRQGLRAAQEIAGDLADRALAKRCSAMIGLNRAGLMKLWSSPKLSWAVGLDEAGAQLPSSGAWYPDGMADAMALCYIVSSTDSKGKRLAESLINRYPHAADLWFIMAMAKFGFEEARNAAMDRHGRALIDSVEHAARIRYLVPGRESFLMNADQIALP